MSSAPDPIDDDLGAPDLRAEGVAVARDPKTLLGSIALFAPAAYAATVVLRDSPHPLLLRLAIGAAALYAIARLAPRVDELVGPARGPGKIALAAASSAAVLGAGIPLHAAATSTFVHVSAILAACVAAGAALRSASAIAGLGGVATARTEPIARAANRLAIAWAVVGLAMAAPYAGAGRLEKLVSLARRGRVALAIAVLAATIAHLLSSTRKRRIELGARERHELLLGATTLAAPAALWISTGLDPWSASARAEHLVIAPGLALSAAVLAAQVVQDPVGTASRVGRAWLVLVAGSVALLFVDTATHGSPLVSLVAGVAIGLATLPVARASGIDGGAAIRASLVEARDAAGATDPNDVARGVLAALRTLAGGPSPVRADGAPPPSPRLMLFSPLREVVLDAAGVPRTRDPAPTGEALPDPDAPSPVARAVPPELLRLLVDEPLGVVRAEVLRALEVRRPDLRPVLRWCEARDAAAVVGLVLDGELEGLLVLPAFPSTDEVGLREARALRAIARLCGTRLSLEAALARASSRAQRAEHRAREIETVLERTHERERRLLSAVASASRPLEAAIAIGGYAPASRALLAEIDQLAHAAAHLVVVHRPGTDPLPWIARLHRASGRRGPLHVVDAARADGADAARWSSADSPIELARDGTLVVRSPHLLPREAQRRLVAALSFREGPGPDPTPVDLRVVLAIACEDPEHDTLERLHGALERSLVAHLREAPVRLLPLARRVEDLRALCLDRLATFGQASRGAPLGLAPEALALLIEHPWPGDDLELEDVLARAAARAPGPRVERADVAAALHAPEPVG